MNVHTSPFLQPPQWLICHPFQLDLINGSCHHHQHVDICTSSPKFSCRKTPLISVWLFLSCIEPIIHSDGQLWRTSLPLYLALKALWKLCAHQLLWPSCPPLHSSSPDKDWSIINKYVHLFEVTRHTFFFWVVRIENGITVHTGIVELDF